MFKVDTSRGMLLPEESFEFLILAIGHKETKNHTPYIGVQMVVRTDANEHYGHSRIELPIWKKREPNEDDMAFDGYNAKTINDISRAVGIEDGTAFEDWDEMFLAWISKPVLGTIKNETYQEKTRSKVAWVNPTKTTGPVKHQYTQGEQDLSLACLHEIDERAAKAKAANAASTNNQPESFTPPAPAADFTALAEDDDVPF